MKRTCYFFLIVICILTPAMVFAIPSETLQKLVGKWGYANIKHTNSGAWHSETGTVVFDYSGNATTTAQYNDNGTLGSNNSTSAYSVTANNDGTISLTISGKTKKCVISDDGKMIIQDGTLDSGQQTMMILVRMDPTRTYSNGDLKGDYYSISYEHDTTGGFIYPAPYGDFSHIDTFGGTGQMSTVATVNAFGTIFSPSVPDNTYTLSSDGTMQASSGYVGYGTGFGEISAGAAPTSTPFYQLHNSLKKGDKTYSSSDLAGTWASVAFGDNSGTSFHSAVGLWNCSSNGNCAVSYKFLQDSSLIYRNDSATLLVAPDGSFGGSLAASAPAYAAAIGDNANAMMMNWGLDTDNPNYRHVKVAVRCNGCVNITHQTIPMIAIDNNFAGMNLYIYDPSTSIINTVKENNNMSWIPSINSAQGLAVYAEGPGPDAPFSIYIYNTSLKSISQVSAEYTLWQSAYLDRNDKILFIDSSDGAVKRMDMNGSNVFTLTSPDSANGYAFKVMWLSPDRDIMAAVEERTPGDYYLTNHDRLVFIDANTGARISTLGEYFGEWWMGIWKADSSRFMYDYHVFDGTGTADGMTSKYAVYSNMSSPTPTATDLSGSVLGTQPDNVCFFTKKGNLLSLIYQKLYNGQTGALIADRSSDVPNVFNTMFGFDGNGEIYFAGKDKSNFRRFVENSSSCQPVNVAGFQYSLIIDGYNSASNSSTIELISSDFTESLNLQKNITAVLQGGYDCSYSTPGSSFSTIHGDLMITAGTVTVDKIAIQ